MPTITQGGRDAARTYPVSLQQAAAAIFGVAIVDGTSFDGARSHGAAGDRAASGHRGK